MDNIHQSVKSGESVVGLETIRQRKDGGLLGVEATLSPIRYLSGNVIGITGICRDVTRRKRILKLKQGKWSLLLKIMRMPF